jgi:hypothetical protein
VSDTHVHVWVEAVVVETPSNQKQTLGSRFALCGICGQGKGVDERFSNRIKSELDAIWQESQADNMIIRDAGIMQECVNRVRVALGEEV